MTKKMKKKNKASLSRRVGGTRQRNSRVNKVQLQYMAATAHFLGRFLLRPTSGIFFFYPRTLFFHRVAVIYCENVLAISL